MRKSLITTALLVIAASGSAFAADVGKGQALAQAQCAACHGKDFKSPIDPSYPILAGQYSDYLEKALREYQSGGRKNPIMGGLAKPLSRDDVRNLAAYFASLPGPLNNSKR